jgi:hypothetical protein
MLIILSPSIVTQYRFDSIYSKIGGSEKSINKKVVNSLGLDENWPTGKSVNVLTPLLVPNR